MRVKIGGRKQQPSAPTVPTSAADRRETVNRVTVRRGRGRAADKKAEYESRVYSWSGCDSAVGIAAVISAGFPGAEMAALRAARATGHPTAGFTVKGCRTGVGDDGNPSLLTMYGLREHSTSSIVEVMVENMKISDAVVLFSQNADPVGEKFDALARKKPGLPLYHYIDIRQDSSHAEASLRDFLRKVSPRRVYMTGVRYEGAEDYCFRVIKAVLQRPDNSSAIAGNDPFAGEAGSTAPTVLPLTERKPRRGRGKSGRTTDTSSGYSISPWSDEDVEEPKGKSDQPDPRSQSWSHRCHAVGCTVEVPPRLLMCSKHWYMVPKALRDEVWQHYRPGQEDDKNPSQEYLKVMGRAISAVYDAEQSGATAKSARRGSGDELEKLNKRYVQRKMMPFGQYKGSLLAEIPTDYLQWVVTNVENTGSGLHESIVRELEFRGEWDVEYSALFEWV